MAMGKVTSPLVQEIQIRSFLEEDFDIQLSRLVAIFTDRHPGGFMWVRKGRGGGAAMNGRFPFFGEP